MSDYETEAYEQAEEVGWYHHDASYKAASNRNTSYYHRDAEFERVVAETEKAYLLAVKGARYWVPKSLCRHMRPEDGRVKIWRGYTWTPQTK